MLRKIRGVECVSGVGKTAFVIVCIDSANANQLIFTQEVEADLTLITVGFSVQGKFGSTDSVGDISICRAVAYLYIIDLRIIGDGDRNLGFFARFDYIRNNNVRVVNHGTNSIVCHIVGTGYGEVAGIQTIAVGVSAHITAVAVCINGFNGIDFVETVVSRIIHKVEFGLEELSVILGNIKVIGVVIGSTGTVIMSIALVHNGNANDFAGIGDLHFNLDGLASFDNAVFIVDGQSIKFDDRRLVVLDSLLSQCHRECGQQQTENQKDG